MSDLGRALAEQMLATTKWCAAALSWSERDNHVGQLLATAQPEDVTGVPLPGLTMQLLVKRPVVVERCLYELGLFQLEHGVRRRVYQLNVTPADKRSHNSAAGPLYGPHEHIGTDVRPVLDPDIVCGRLEIAFALYCRRINLIFTGHLNPPI